MEINGKLIMANVWGGQASVSLSTWSGIKRLENLLLCLL